MNANTAEKYIKKLSKFKGNQNNSIIELINTYFKQMKYLVAESVNVGIVDIYNASNNRKTHHLRDYLKEINNTDKDEEVDADNKKIIKDLFNGF